MKKKKAFQTHNRDEESFPVPNNVCMKTSVFARVDFIFSQ